MSENDAENIAAALVQRMLPTVVESLRRQGQAAAKKSIIERTISRYVTEIYSKNIKTKTYFFQDEPRYFYDFYIPLNVSIGKEIFEHFSYNKALFMGNLIAIVGAAGSGKTILMKHLLLDCINEGHQIPLFLELRDYNLSQENFDDWILSKLGVLSNVISHDSLFDLFDAGRIILFLDGYDEVTHEKRVDVTTAVTGYASRYPDTKIIISSRPDDVFRGWIGFTTLSVCQLDKEQALQLLKLLPYDREAKNKFIYELENKLFSSHASFLTNPLLLTIMLITYGKYADIPNKLSLFYNQAFEALYQKHDAAKGIFKRPLLSKLDIDDYSNIFSSFCLQTYVKRHFRFSHSDAIVYLKKAIRSSGLNISADNFLTDSKQGINMLVDDGIELSYSHRSFQEFFVARYISGCSQEIASKLLRRFGRYAFLDSVLQLVSELNLRLLEECLIAPALGRIFDSIQLAETANMENLYMYIQQYWQTINVHCYRTDTDAPIEEAYIVGKYDDENYEDLVVLLWCYNRFGWSVSKGFQQRNDLYIARKYCAFNEDDDDTFTNIYFETKNLEKDGELFQDLASGLGQFSLAYLNGARAYYTQLGDKKSILENEIEILLQEQ